MFTCGTLKGNNSVNSMRGGVAWIPNRKQTEGNSIKHAWRSDCHLPSVCQCGSLCVS